MSYQDVTLLSRPIGIRKKYVLAMVSLGEYMIKFFSNIDPIRSCHKLNLPGKKV